MPAKGAVEKPRRGLAEGELSLSLRLGQGGAADQGSPVTNPVAHETFP